MAWGHLCSAGVMPGGFRISPLYPLPKAHASGTWWAETVEGGEQVQAGAARAAGLGQALVVVSLAAGARVARRAEAVKGARGVEARAAVFTGTGALLGWEERRVRSPQWSRVEGQGGQTAREGMRACLWRMRANQRKSQCF